MQVTRTNDFNKYFIISFIMQFNKWRDADPNGPELTLHASGCSACAERSEASA